ncbi:uncharacterized protein LOC129580601 [Paramacrobiotus metropolitanus]|uniref:uncharacterized protein LOC129580601 n=1 Tax=Paramacrobiotus metropolitanus TaxID=2943436 RepID=UPI0024461FBC|nr:uncharacterized protein LOC129580601 [Paramacrobiotus metropolitanus]
MFRYILLLATLIALLGSALADSESRNRQNARRCLRYGRIALADGSATDGYKNAKGCGCEAARDQEWNQPQFANNYAPVCARDGKWKSVQDDQVNMWCVDSQGNQVSRAVPKNSRGGAKPC